MIELDEYNKLKKKLDRVEQKRQRAVGALNQLLAQLKTEFDCDSFEAAKLKLKELKSEQQVQEVQFTKTFREFQRKYSRFLASCEREDPTTE